MLPACVKEFFCFGMNDTEQNRDDKIKLTRFCRTHLETLSLFKNSVPF